MSAPRLSRRARHAGSVAGALAGMAVVAVLAAGKGDEFGAALHAAPFWILALAAALQLTALVARSEAWHVGVRATGATVSRRRLYRAASVGYVVVVANSQLGVAARIAALRHANPHDSPRVPALIAAEVPILATEAVLAAAFSFTLVGPLGLPWFVPLGALAVALGLGAGLCSLARRRPCGLWSGLAVLRTVKGRERIVGLVLICVLAQIVRNWLVLRATGTPVSVLDSIAVLIAMVTIGQLPLGPSVGAAATVLILGTHGVATVAAAGVLLTATGTIGALCFGAWALTDWVCVGRRRPQLPPAPALPAPLPAVLPAQR
jgi:hypothetical protein